MGLAFEKLSRTTTDRFVKRSSTTVCEPMNPAPPVTRMVK